jgi:glycosyltransferase involved in cell wall biosynthesis
MFTSVIIPTRNAVDRLLYTLYSLNLQYTSFDEFEVIVLDNASTDATAERLIRFSAHYRLRCHRARRPLCHHDVLNAGIAFAKGELMIFLGSDLIVPREFVGVHRQAHGQTGQTVLVGGNVRRIYSVYYPQFSRAQRDECQAWLEHYPQVKRPHTFTEVVPLLEGWQMHSGLPFLIALPDPNEEKRIAFQQKYGERLERFPDPWKLFFTEHASLTRDAIKAAGAFPALTRKEMEQVMGKRLMKAGYSLQYADKLTLLRQERPPTTNPEQKTSRKSHRAG